MKSSSFFLLFLFLSFFSSAQEKEAQFTPQIGLITTTTATMDVSGTDSSFSNSFAMAPVLGLLHKSGLGVQYKPYYISGSKSGIYMHALTAFFEQYDKPTFNINASYTNFIFTNKTDVPYSPLSNELYAYAAYKKLWLNPVLASSLGFGLDSNNNSAIDFSLAGGVSHSFDWETDKLLSSVEIEPSLLLNGGTNRYFSFLTTSKYITNNKKYKGYTIAKNNSGKRNGNNNGNGNGNSNSNSGNTTFTPTTAEAQTQNFHLSNVEIGLYSRFTIHNFRIIPSGGLFLPLTYSTDVGVTGYWQLLIGYGF